MRLPIACLVLLASLPACTTWRVEKGVGPPQLISAEHPTKVRLTQADGSYIVLHDPQVSVGDSLSGVRSGLVSGTPVRVACSDVTEVAIRKVSASRTIGLAAGIVIVSYVVLAAAMSDDDLFANSQCTRPEGCGFFGQETDGSTSMMH